MSRRGLVEKFTAFSAGVLGPRGPEAAARILAMDAGSELAGVIRPLRG